MDARIGQLMREGKTVFYAFVASRYVEGTQEQVEIALGIRKARRVLRRYTVTVTPKYAAYSGSWSAGEYKSEVVAYDRAEAIKQARQEFNENNFSNAATYRARLAA